MKTNTITLTDKELQLLNEALDFITNGLADDHILLDVDLYKIFNKKERTQISKEVYESNKDIFEDDKPHFEDLGEFWVFNWLKDKINKNSK